MAAHRWRDRVLRLLPNKRSQPIPARILSKLRLKQPVVGVSRYETRRFYSVTYHGAKGTDASANFFLARSQGRIGGLCGSDKIQTKEDEVPISQGRRQSAKRLSKSKRLYRCILSNPIDPSGYW
jgi:hypothetical protein